MVSKPSLMGMLMSMKIKQQLFNPQQRHFYLSRHLLIASCPLFAVSIIKDLLLRMAFITNKLKGSSSTAKTLMQHLLYILIDYIHLSLNILVIFISLYAQFLSSGIYSVFIWFFMYVGILLLLLQIRFWPFIKVFVLTSSLLASYIS